MDDSTKIKKVTNWAELSDSDEESNGKEEHDIQHISEITKGKGPAKENDTAPIKTENLETKTNNMVEPTKKKFVNERRNQTKEEMLDELAKLSSLPTIGFDLINVHYHATEDHILNYFHGIQIDRLFPKTFKGQYKLIVLNTDEAEKIIQRGAGELLGRPFYLELNSQTNRPHHDKKDKYGNFYGNDNSSKHYRNKKFDHYQYEDKEPTMPSKHWGNMKNTNLTVYSVKKTDQVKEENPNTATTSAGTSTSVAKAEKEQEANVEPIKYEKVEVQESIDSSDKIGTNVENKLKEEALNPLVVENNENNQPIDVQSAAATNIEKPNSVLNLKEDAEQQQQNPEIPKPDNDQLVQKKGRGHMSYGSRGLESDKPYYKQKIDPKKKREYKMFIPKKLETEENLSEVDSANLLEKVSKDNNSNKSSEETEVKNKKSDINEVVPNTVGSGNVDAIKIELKSDKIAEFDPKTDKADIEKPSSDRDDGASTNKDEESHILPYKKDYKKNYEYKNYRRDYDESNRRYDPHHYNKNHETNTYKPYESKTYHQYNTSKGYHNQQQQSHFRKSYYGSSNDGSSGQYYNKEHNEGYDHPKSYNEKDQGRGYDASNRSDRGGGGYGPKTNSDYYDMKSYDRRVESKFEENKHYEKNDFYKKYDKEIIDFGYDDNIKGSRNTNQRGYDKRDTYNQQNAYNKKSDSTSNTGHIPPTSSSSKHEQIIHSKKIEEPKKKIQGNTDNSQKSSQGKKANTDQTANIFELLSS